MNKKKMSVSEIRDNIGQVLEEAHYGHKHFVVTRRGRPYAVIVDGDEYNSMGATLEEMADPEALKALKEAKADSKAGRTKNFEEVFDYVPKFRSRRKKAG